MARDASGQSTTELPDDVGDRIAELAREGDVSEGELFSRLLDTSGDIPDPGGLNDRFESVESDLAALEDRIDDLDTDLEEKVSDVRERVIQVKREADAKADAEHGHPGLASEVTGLAADVSDLEDDIDALEDRIDASITDITDETADLRTEVDSLDTEVNRKLNVLGAAVVELRDRIQTLLTAREKRAALEELQTKANRNGVGTAKCESCSNTVRVGLLAEPRCPHCEESFKGVDVKNSFFRSSVLETGRPPALEGEVAATDSDPDDAVGR